MPARQPDDLDDALADLAAKVAVMQPADLERWAAGLDPADLDLLERAVGANLAQGWRADPAAMAHYLTGGTFKLWRYTTLLSRRFADLVAGRSKRQIWNVPSRYGKSTVARWGVAWCLDLHPDAGLIITSYGDKLAQENGDAVRDILTLHRGQLRAQLRQDRNQRGLFRTEQGGHVLCAGIGSGIAGFGAGNHGGVVVDDPYKNWQEAHSETVRDSVLNKYRTVLRLRLDDETAWELVIHTRWHEDDLSGVLLADTLEQRTQEPWELVRLPAIAEEYDPGSDDPFLRIPDPLGREVGEVIEPEKFSLVEVQARATEAGSYLAASVEQQRPAPQEGGELKRSWWQWYATRPASFDQMISSWDTKAKDKQSGDYVVGQVWGKSGANLYLLEQLRGQWSQLTMECAIALIQHRWPTVTRHVVENTGYGPEAMKSLREKRPGFEVPEAVQAALGLDGDELAAVEAIVRAGLAGIIPENPKGDKRARARAHAGKLEAGNVWLNENDPEALYLVNEAAAFPNGAHDDATDAFSQAMSRLTAVPATLSAPRRPLPKPPTSVGVPRIRPFGPR